MAERKKVLSQLRYLEKKAEKKARCEDPEFRMTKKGKVKKYCDFYEDDIAKINKKVAEGRLAYPKRVPKAKVPKSGRQALTYQYGLLNRRVKNFEKKCADEDYADKNPGYCGDILDALREERAMIDAERKMIPKKTKSKKEKAICDVNYSLKPAQGKQWVTLIKEAYGIKNRKVASLAYSNAKRTIKNKCADVNLSDTNDNATRFAILAASLNYLRKKQQGNFVDIVGSGLVGSGLVGGCGPCMNCGYES